MSNAPNDLAEEEGSIDTGYEFTWHFQTYADAVSEYAGHFGRSILYAGIATVLCLVIGFPLANRYQR